MAKKRGKWEGKRWTEGEKVVKAAEGMTKMNRGREEGTGWWRGRVRDSRLNGSNVKGRRNRLTGERKGEWVEGKGE